MRVASSTIQSLAMSSSSSFRYRARGGRHPWRRGFSDRPCTPDAEDPAAPVSGDSHHRNVRDANYALRRGQPGAAASWVPEQQPQPPPRRYQRPPPGSGFPPRNWSLAPYYRNPPSPLGFVPPPPYAPAPDFAQPPLAFRPPQLSRLRHADYYRNWNYCRSQPPPHCEKFVILSYNILADYLAREHRSKLYFHIPHYILDWEWRKKRLLLEFRLWGPDIMCLQEVDRFHDLEVDLASQGYSGIWKMRTGKAVDGCAIFWRTTRFQLRYEEYIEYNSFGLRDNVAQICVLESRIDGDSESNYASLSGSSNQSRQANQVVICNIHVLYNPKRGEIKLGQVRTLLDRAHAVSSTWSNAPVIVCGDFNCTPKSALYNFIADQKLDFAGLPRDQASGQFTGSLSYHGSFMPRPKHPPENLSHFSQIGGHEKHTVTMHMPQSFSSSKFLSKNNTDPGAIPNTRTDRGCVSDEKVEPSSDLCRTLESSNQLSSNLGYIVKDGNKKSIGTLGDQSSQRDQNKLGEHSEPINGIIQSSAELENNSSAPSVDITFNEGSVECEENAKGCGSLLLENSTESAYGTIYGDENEPVCSNLGHVTTDFTHKENSPLGSSTSANSTLESVKQDSTSSCDLESNSLDDLSGNSCNVDKFIDQNLDAVSISANISSLEVLNHVNKGHISYNELCPSEETADSNFFRELLGTEEACTFPGDDVTSTILGQYQSCSAMHDLEMDPSSVRLETDNSSPFAVNSQDNPYIWTPLEIEVASGNSECTSVEHSLKLRSVYTDVEDYAGTKSLTREPEVTSYNRQFMGTVDYIWSSESLQTVKVLDTIPKHVLQQTPGFPTKKWGSDHIALVCQLAFKQSSTTD